MQNIKEIINVLNSLSEAEKSIFLEEILTQNELNILSKRWRILKMLNQGLTQREVVKALDVSLCNVTRGAKILKDKNAIVGKILKEKNND